MNDKKLNIPFLILGVFIIIVSSLNYLMTEDYVSLGIFVFAGIGLILLSVKNKFSIQSTARFEKYANTFFFGSAIILIYWFFKVKMGIF